MRSFRIGRALLGISLAATMLAAPARAADLSQYLPDGTLLVVSFNIKQLMDAPLVKSDEKAFKDGMAEVTKALEGFGVEPGIWFRLLIGGITGHQTFAHETGVVVRPVDAIKVADAIVRGDDHARGRWSLQDGFPLLLGEITLACHRSLLSLGWIGQPRSVGHQRRQHNNESRWGTAGAASGSRPPSSSSRRRSFDVAHAAVQEARASDPDRAASRA